MKTEAANIESRRELPAQPNQSLIGGIECLEMLFALRRPVGCRELARLLNMDATRVNRLLKTLTALGLAERNPAQKYQPGPGIHVLASMSLHASNLLKVTLRHLPPLLAGFPDLKIALGVLWRSQVCYLFYGRHGQPLKSNLGHSELFPAEDSSIGCVLLAALPKTDTKQSLRNQRDLTKISQQGYALINGNSLGVPVGNPPVAGLAAAGVFSPDRIPLLLKALQETAAKIAAEL